MRVKVVKEFIDLRNNKKKRKVGEILEVTQDRFKELNSTSFGVLVDEVEETKEAKKIKEGAKYE
ncbi:MAG TPA: hypothetical protein PKI14_09185 [Fervidobacterium sp.]|nr:hypothetical protein [Fervidobacterium sp.]